MVFAQVVPKLGDGGVLGRVVGDDGVLDGIFVLPAGLLGSVDEGEGAAHPGASDALQLTLLQGTLDGLGVRLQRMMEISTGWPICFGKILC